MEYTEDDGILDVGVVEDNSNDDFIMLRLKVLAVKRQSRAYRRVEVGEVFDAVMNREFGFTPGMWQLDGYAPRGGWPKTKPVSAKKEEKHKVTTFGIVLLLLYLAAIFGLGFMVGDHFGPHQSVIEEPFAHVRAVVCKPEGCSTLYEFDNRETKWLWTPANYVVRP